MALSQTGPSAVGKRNSPARFQVLRWYGPPGKVDVLGCPPEEFSDSRRSRPGQPEGVIVVDEVAGGQVPG
jgi:hypothetical protein